MKEKIKTAAIVLFAVSNIAQAWLKAGPCEALNAAMNAVGVDILTFNQTEPVDVGPPLSSKVVVELEDGTIVKILQNGGVIVQ